MPPKAEENGGGLDSEGRQGAESGKLPDRKEQRTVDESRIESPTGHM